MPRRIAIVALGPSHDEAPYEKWETWGLGWDAWAPRFDRILEMHERELWEQRGPEYIEKLNDADIPVYMQRRHIEIPKAVEYPLWQVIGEVGDYFGSSPAYWLALAIHEGVDEIGLWGVDLKDENDSYLHQRENLEYLIGFARGRGIHVRVNDFSTLLTFRSEDKFLGKSVSYRKRYGFL
jgi:hypothetical protein